VIAVLVVPDTMALEVAVAQQIFGRPMPSVAAITGDAESPYDVVLCGANRRRRLWSGVDVGELSPTTMAAADTVIVPGVENPLGNRSEELLRQLRRAHGAGARMVSYCGGAIILGQAGILDGRRATTHWIMSNEFRAAFPHVQLDVDHLLHQ
jgi:AraC family transcriptional activator FtrA